jgi:hypothetical protein
VATWIDPDVQRPEPGVAVLALFKPTINEPFPMRVVMMTVEGWWYWHGSLEHCQGGTQTFCDTTGQRVRCWTAVLAPPP